MAAFPSTAELHRTVGDFFRYIAESRAGETVARSELIAAFVFREPAGRVVLDGRSTRAAGEHFVVHVGNFGPKPDVTFTMTSDAAEQVFTGGMPIMLALVNGTIKARGAVGKALPLVPAVSAWIPLYVKWRRERGD
jgi:hypothetical protein